MRIQRLMSIAIVATQLSTHLFSAENNSGEIFHEDFSSRTFGQWDIIGISPEIFFDRYGKEYVLRTQMKNPRIVTFYLLESNSCKDVKNGVFTCDVRTCDSGFYRQTVFFKKKDPRSWYAVEIFREAWREGPDAKFTFIKSFNGKITELASTRVPLAKSWTYRIPDALTGLWNHIRIMMAEGQYNIYWDNRLQFSITDHEIQEGHIAIGGVPSYWTTIDVDNINMATWREYFDTHIYNRILVAKDKINEVDFDELIKTAKKIKEELSMPVMHATVPDKIEQLEIAFNNQLIKQLENKNYLIWAKHPYEIVLNTQSLCEKVYPGSRIPADNITQDLKELKLFACLREYEPCAFVISNLTNETLTGRLNISHFRDEKGQKIFCGDLIESIKVATVRKLKSDGEYFNHLIALNEFRELVIPTKENCEIFITFKTHKLKAGIYTGSIIFVPYEESQLPPKAFNIKLKVYPVVLPEKAPILLSAYSKAFACSPELMMETDKPDYTQLGKDFSLSYGMGLGKDYKECGAKLHEKHVEEMIKHGFTAFLPLFGWSGSWYPYPLFNKQREITNILDPYKTAFLDRTLQMWKKHAPPGSPIILAAASPPEWPFGKLEEDVSEKTKWANGKYFYKGAIKYLSSEWKNIFKKWWTTVIGHLKQQGFDYNQFYIAIRIPYYHLFSEEERVKEHTDMTLYKLMREIDPQVKIAFILEAIATDDDVRYACSFKPDMYIGYPYEEHIKIAGQYKIPYFVYTMGEGNRRLLWNCWKIKDNIVGWYFDGYGTSHSFPSVRSHKNGSALSIGFGENGPISRREWESYRDGVDDYKYFYLLEAAIRKSKEKGLDTQKAEQILNESISSLGSFSDYNMDLEFLDKSREDIIGEIMKLSGNQENKR